MQYVLVLLEVFLSCSLLHGKSLSSDKSLNIMLDVLLNPNEQEEQGGYVPTHEISEELQELLKESFDELQAQLDALSLNIRSIGTVEERIESLQTMADQAQRIQEDILQRLDISDADVTQNPTSIPEPVECDYDDYRCDNGRCVAANCVCNGLDDCIDGSDERGCSTTATVSCANDEFTCGNGQCIRDGWRCDGDNDCGDGSDEAVEICRSVTEEGSPQCNRNQVSCDNGECILETWMCDGEADCDDGSDEKPEVCALGEYPCSTDNFKCDNGRCISGSWLCDEEDDCGDGSDEAICHSGSTTAGILNITSEPNEAPPVTSPRATALPTRKPINGTEEEVPREPSSSTEIPSEAREPATTSEAAGRHSPSTARERVTATQASTSREPATTSEAGGRHSPSTTRERVTATEASTPKEHVATSETIRRHSPSTTRGRVMATEEPAQKESTPLPDGRTSSYNMTF